MAPRADEPAVCFATGAAIVSVASTATLELGAGPSCDGSVPHDDATEPGPSTVLTVDELATLLRCNRKTVYGAIQRGEIPGVRRLGGAIRVHRETVLRWLADGQGHVSRSRR